MVLLSIGVIYTGDAGDMSPPLFEMADFVPTTFWKHLVKMFFNIQANQEMLKVYLVKCLAS